MPDPKRDNADHPFVGQDPDMQVTPNRQSVVMCIDPLEEDPEARTAIVALQGHVVEIVFPDDSVVLFDATELRAAIS